jgi:hypothetical protein
MKRTSISTAALVFLITGLLLTSGLPVLARYYPVSDTVKGLLTGLGLGIEIIGIIKLDRGRKNLACKA